MSVQHASGGIPVVPVMQFERVKLRDIHVFSLPGGLVIGQVFPLNQVVHVVLFIHTDHTEQDGARHRKRDKINIFAVFLFVAHFCRVDINKLQLHYMCVCVCV